MASTQALEVPTKSGLKQDEFTFQLSQEYYGFVFQ